LKYFVLAEFHPPRLSFGGVMPPTPSGASLHYGLPYSIWQAIITLLGDCMGASNVHADSNVPSDYTSTLLLIRTHTFTF